MTRVSVAMATYNGALFVGKQLESFAEQTTIPNELVVCDDNSGDNTVDVIRAFQNTAPFPIHLLQNEQRLGYTRNFERALSMCSGDLIFLSDQDDVWYPNKIEFITNKMQTLANTHVIVHDAQYTDDNLVPASTTVLQRVVEYSGSEAGHIHGAATAISKRFRDFILPFPLQNCPAHDVYIHRWANLLAVKNLSHDILQVWRRHPTSTTSESSEMSHAIGLTNIQLYRKYQDVDVSKTYLQKAREFREMIHIAQERREAISHLTSEVDHINLITKLNDLIEAHENRSRLSDMGWFARKKQIGRMVYKGQYKYFQGVKSILKDILT